MREAVVIRNIVDLNLKPDFHSERRSQLLFGERVTVLRESGLYSEVRQGDGYHGHVRNAALWALDRGALEAYTRATPARVQVSVSTLYDNSGAPAKPYFLSYGSRVFVIDATPKADARTEVLYLPGEQRFIDTSDITLHSDIESWKGRSAEDLSDSVVTAAFQFLGVPYLWGGASSLALDCSGLTQLVYSMHGLTLPRDSKDQREVGQVVPRAQLEAGDLLFFEGHVCMSMGADTFIHASLGEGGVEINSFDSSRSNYRKDLDEGFLVARRHW